MQKQNESRKLWQFSEIKRAGGGDKRKQSLYFPEEMLQEITREAERQDRSLSWIVQQAWRIARGEISRFPSVDDVLGGR